MDAGAGELGAKALDERELPGLGRRVEAARHAATATTDETTISTAPLAPEDFERAPAL
ncbi:MAG: hypothetical protein R2752_11190 [Vicinamibacterales bacterium]